MSTWPESIAARVEFAGIEVKRLAEVCGVSRATIHNILRGKEPAASTVAAVESGLRVIAASLAPEESCCQYAGVDALAADHALLTTLGAGEPELARVRELLGEKEGELYT
jgi:transcriptional regulator with XRE-family HTH domain